MAIAEDNALSGLHQFLAATQPLQSLQRSPEKMPTMNDLMSTVFQQLPTFSYPTPVDAKAAGSSDSDTPRNQSPNSDGATETQPSLGGKEPRPYRQEPWHECFTTVNKKEFDALIYSLYVMARDDKKLDGYEYYECINRLQSKCRYRVRARRMNEFIIVEERGGHNHAMEPVGTPGTHAGLPKTLREIVDRSFYEDWNNAVRQEKLEEEVRRLGLPHNPRLGRQVDNRIAYLRRVKNLNEMKKIQDQIAPMPNGDLASEGEKKTNGMPDVTAQAAVPAMENPTDLLQMLMQNSRFPELNADNQAQLMALMMSGAAAAPSMRMEDGNGGQDMLTNPSAVLPALLANPFLHATSSMPNLLPLSVDNSIDNTSAMVDTNAESGDMEDDDDCSTEDDHLHIDADQ
nr:Protein T05H10.4, isoform a [Haemonchus contortus]